MSKIINFEDARDRADKAAYHAVCNDLYDRIDNVLCNSQAASDKQLAWVTLSAVIDMLEERGVDKKKAKVIIAWGLALL